MRALEKSISNPYPNPKPKGALEKATAALNDANESVAFEQEQRIRDLEAAENDLNKLRKRWHQEVAILKHDLANAQKVAEALPTKKEPSEMREKSPPKQQHVSVGVLDDLAYRSSLDVSEHDRLLDEARSFLQISKRQPHFKSEPQRLEVTFN